MSLDLIIYCILGVACGTFTGLVPGIHVNTAAPMALSLSKSAYLDPLLASVFICSMSITHTFIDFIPATVLGIPDPDMSLTVLPAHSMVLAGRGWEAISLSGIASLLSVIIIVLSMPVLMPSIKCVYPLISSSTLPILVIFSSVTILIHRGYKRKLMAAFAFGLSGFFGYVVLNDNVLFSDPLMPVFSGMFGLSSLLLGFMGGGNMPKQVMDNSFFLSKAKIFSASLKGTLSGILVSTVPGIGASQATILSNVFSKGDGEEGKRQFIVSCCSINTSNAFFAIMVLYLFGKARNGALICVQEILDTMMYSEFEVLLAVSIVTSFLAFFSLNIFGRLALDHVFKINYSYLCIFGIFFQLMIVLVLTGLAGLLLCAVATAVGILPPSLNINRSTLMGFLMIPVMTYYIG